MSGAPPWAVELYLQNLTLERLMTELQDTLNTYAGEIAGAVSTINTEIGTLEQQIAAGATPDLTTLKAAVDSLGNTATRITAVASGQPDPLTAASANTGSDGEVQQPAPDSGVPAEATAPVQPETIDTAASIDSGQQPA